MHILIGIPSQEQVSSDFALGNLQDIISYTHKKYPDWHISTAYHYGTRTDQNRNFILKEALKDPTIDYLLWLDCLTGTTPLMVRKNGFIDFVEIQELIPKSERGIRTRTYTHVPYEVMTRDGWQNIQAVRQIMTKKKIKRLAGECVFSATEDHRVFIDGKETFIKDLKIGDIIDKSDHIEDTNYNSWTNDFAEMAGFFMAEGSSNAYDGSYQWYLCNSKKELLEKYRIVIEGFFGERTYIVTDTAKEKMYKLYASNPKVLYEFFRKYFYSDDSNKKVPIQILNSSKEIIKSFLDGFISGDGYIDNRGRISITERSNVGMAGLAYLYKKIGKELRFHIRDDKDTIQGFVRSEVKRKPGVNKILDESDQEWVYDINTDSGTFVGGVGDVIFHNCDMLYPQEIIERYFDCFELGQTIDVIGCLYFKRAYPYDPIAYEKSDNPVKPFKTLLPSAVKDDMIYEVAGLGYGGMMVNMKVYEVLGNKRWTVYGSNFHLPYDAPDHLTHDLKFCQDVKEAGLSIKLHGAVRPGHLMYHPVTIEDWRKATEETFVFKKNPPKVQVIMPVTNQEQGKKAAEIMRQRAGADCDIAVVYDDQSKGFVHIVNHIARISNYEVICYTAQDVFVGSNWLKHALMRMMTTDAGLVAFHDGKWAGRLASFGLVQRSWFRTLYNGDVFFPGYWGNYADTELTQIAKQQGRYAYAEKAVMLEVDYDKALGVGKGTVKADKKLYKKRKLNGFDGKITDSKLLEEFS